MNKFVVCVMLCGLIGCANLEKTSLAQVENPVEAHTVSLHEKVKNLTLVGIHVPTRWLLTGLGYYTQDESLLRRDAWKVMVVTDQGIREASAVMGDGCVNILALIEMTPYEIAKAHIFVLSGGGADGHSKSVLDVNGNIIGPLAHKNSDKEDIDIDRFVSDAAFRKEFLHKHPSTPQHSQLFDASEGTAIRTTFLAEMQRRFPGITQDGQSRVSPSALSASAESNQSTTLDKVLSNVHLTADPSLMTFPVGPALKMAGLIVASYQAAQLPLNGSFEGAQFDPVLFADRMGECHQSLVAKFNLNHTVAH